MFFFNNQQDPQEFCFKIYILFQKKLLKSKHPTWPLGVFLTRKHPHRLEDYSISLAVSGDQASVERVCPLNDASFQPSNKKCEALRTRRMNSQVAKVGTIETFWGEDESLHRE